ncbi:hypothetical protein [Rhodopseudomonas sp. B29]|uniref:hypothetical protein n=1 Tax=Rhodopseudomonas sp. B29 TaxID=95607 RepID=UPI000344DD2A|nr:hypothetical protein [Rhodopseudomonas sp. B29]
MKLLGSMMSAALLAGAATADAQPVPRAVLAAPGAVVVSDFDGPYSEEPPPRYRPEVREEILVPDLLPPREIAAIARDEGFEPLGPPQPRGRFYTVVVIDPDGEDGRLVMDGRSGRLMRFVPAGTVGEIVSGETMASLGPVRATRLFGPERHPPRPPRAIPHLASRGPLNPPMPRPAPQQPVGTKAAKQVPATAAVPAKDATKPTTDTAPKQQTASSSPAPVTPGATAVSATPTPAGPVAAKPAFEPKPTEAMPPAQGLD